MNMSMARSMLKIFGLTTMLLFFTNHLWAQSIRDVYEFAPKVEKKNKFRFSKESRGILVNSAPQGNTYLIFGSAQWYLHSISVDQNIVLDTLVRKPIEDGDIQIIGSSKKGERVVFFYLNKTKTAGKSSGVSINGLEVNLETAEILNHMGLLKGKNVLATYSKRDIFHFAYTEEDSTITFAQYAGINRLETKSFRAGSDAISENLNTEQWKSDLMAQNKKALVSFFTPFKLDDFNKGLQYIAEDEVIRAEDIMSDKKYYHIGENVYLTSEVGTTTRVINFNLENGRVTSQGFEASIDNPTSHPIKSNSFIYDGKLFKVHFNKHQWQFDAYHLDTETLIKSYNYSKDDVLEIINTVVDEKNLESKLITETEFKRILNKSTQNLTQAVIAVNIDNSGAYNVEMGLTKRITYNNVNNFWMHDHMMWQMQQQQMNQDFLRNVPVPSFPRGGPSTTDTFNQYQYSSSWLLSFQSIFETETMDHVSGTPRETSRYDFSGGIERATEDLQIYQIYRNRDHYHVVYYSKPSKSFVVKSIEEGW